MNIRLVDFMNNSPDEVLALLPEEDLRIMCYGLTLELQLEKEKNNKNQN